MSAQPVQATATAVVQATAVVAPVAATAGATEVSGPAASSTSTTTTAAAAAPAAATDATAAAVKRDGVMGAAHAQRQGTRASFRQVQDLLSECDKLPLDKETTCDIGDRQLNRFASMLTSAVRFASATPSNTISVTRGQKVVQAFLRRKDSRPFVKQHGAAMPEDERKVQTALLMQENVLNLLKALRGNSTNDACMLRNVIYASIVPNAEASALEVAANEAGQDADGDVKTEGAIKPQTIEHKREIKKVVNVVAGSFGLKNSSNPKQVVKLQMMRAYESRARFMETKNVHDLAHFKRKSNAISKGTSRAAGRPRTRRPRPARDPVAAAARAVPPPSSSSSAGEHVPLAVAAGAGGPKAVVAVSAQPSGVKPSPQGGVVGIPPARKKGRTAK